MAGLSFIGRVAGTLGGGKMPLELLDLARLSRRAFNGIDQ
jgi:hypothetical protein